MARAHGDAVDDPARAEPVAARACRWSAGPAAVEPVVTTTSALASSSAASRASSVSGTCTGGKQRPPAQATQPGSIGPSASRTRPSRAGPALEQLVAEHEDGDVGRADDGERVVARPPRPCPTTAGVTTPPASSRCSPAAALLRRAGGRRCRARRSPGAARSARRRVADVEPPAADVVEHRAPCSRRSTASAPTGSAAPVATVTARAVGELVERGSGEQVADDRPTGPGRRRPSRPSPAASKGGSAVEATSGCGEHGADRGGQRGRHDGQRSGGLAGSAPRPRPTGSARPQCTLTRPILPPAAPERPAARRTAPAAAAAGCRR